MISRISALSILPERLVTAGPYRDVHRPFDLSIRMSLMRISSRSRAAVEDAAATTKRSPCLEDETGKRWTFEGGGKFAGFTPSHLEEHMTLREQVRVEYEEDAAGVLIILSVSD